MSEENVGKSSKFEETLSKLPKHPHSLSGSYETLRALRKLVEWPKHREYIKILNNSPYLKMLVNGLRSSKPRIVSIILSIIGNCCMDKCTNEMIFQCNVLTELHGVVLKYPREDGINGRAFRIIGNLAQHYAANIMFTERPQLIVYLVKFIQNYAEETDNDVDENCDFTEATIVMGVRALRLILNDHTFETLCNMQFLKAIGTLLVKCSENWISNNKDRNVLDNIVRLLLYVSKEKSYNGFIQFKQTPRGDSLVSLSTILKLHPRKIVRIINNYAKICQSKSELPIPEVCNELVRLLEKGSSATVRVYDENDRDYITCLCYLLEHPDYRNPYRYCKVIATLIKVLNEIPLLNEKNLDLCILIVSTLETCTFHPSCVKEMSESNIIDVLVNKISILLPENAIKNHRIQPSRKRKCEFPDSPKSFNSNKSPTSPSTSPIFSNQAEEWHLPRVYTNPPICNTSRMSTPSPSPSFSDSHSRPDSPDSMASSFVYRDQSDSDYSPVCTDVEEDDAEENRAEKTDNDNLEMDQTNASDRDDENEKQAESLISFKNRLLQSILLLIKNCWLDFNYCSEKLILVMMRCCCCFEYGSLTIHLAKQALKTTLRNQEYLIPLMQTEVIFEAHELLEPQHNPARNRECSRCNHVKEIGEKIINRFTELAESAAGRGEIAHLLLTAKIEIKNRIVVAVPFVIRDKKLLKTFMLKCGGLEILLKCLQDVQDDSQKRATTALHLLSFELIKNPQYERFASKSITTLDDSQNNQVLNVTFLLDDGSHLRANRDFICSSSTYFNALLNGDFRESKENVVKLHQVDRKALKSLISLMRLELENLQLAEIDLDTETLLEVIMLCDRYCLVELCSYVSECVQKYNFRPQNIPLIYEWSLESKTNIFRVECIAYLLVDHRNTDQMARHNIFRTLFNRGLKNVIIDDIREVIVRHLQSI